MYKTGVVSRKVAPVNRYVICLICLNKSCFQKAYKSAVVSGKVALLTNIYVIVIIRKDKFQISIYSSSYNFVVYMSI